MFNAPLDPLTEVTEQPVEPHTFSCTDAHTAFVKLVSSSKSAGAASVVMVIFEEKLPLSSVGVTAAVEAPEDDVLLLPTSALTPFTLHKLVVKELARPVVKLVVVPVATVP